MIGVEVQVSPSLQKLATALGELARSEVAAGYPEGVADADIIKRALALEYRWNPGEAPPGTDIPARWTTGPQYQGWAFMRRAGMSLGSRLESLINSWLVQGMGGEEIQARLGEMSVDEIRRAILRVTAPPLAERTIEIKRRLYEQGKAIAIKKPLIRTGRMAAEPTWVIRKPKG